jgi:muramoyltetrapeptide carboxypeptidase
VNPAGLRIGDRVRVIAPAGRLPPDVLTAGVARLAGWGLHVSLGEHVRDRHPTLPYLAGTDTDRATDVQQAGAIRRWTRCSAPGAAPAACGCSMT